MVRKRIAVVQPQIVPGGGTEAVTAWSIEALKQLYDVTLVTFSKTDADVLNAYYGTDLRDEEYSVARPSLPLLLNRTRRFALLKDHLMMRYCKSAHSRFDLFFSVGGHMDFGVPGMQYLAYAPGSTLIRVLRRDPSLPLWQYMIRKGLMDLFQLFSKYSAVTMQQNVTLLTSRWTGEEIGAAYSFSHSKVVYPPVEAVASNTPWDMRDDSFLCIARIVPEKLVEDAIEVLKRVRDEGFNITLHIIGRPDDPAYYRRIQQLASANVSWVFLHGVIPKEELFAMMGRSKYGINPALGEPSGVAALEMVKAGCIVFVRGCGGLAEIIDSPPLTYDDIDDAVSKVKDVLSSGPLQVSLRKDLDRQGEGFSTQAFCENLRKEVHDFFVEP